MQNILNSSKEMFLIFHQNMSLNILMNFVLVKKNIVLCDFLCGLCENIYHLKLNFNLVSWCWIQNVIMLSFVLFCGHSLIARFTNISFLLVRASASVNMWSCLSIRPPACVSDQAHFAWFTSGVPQGQKTTYDGRRPAMEDDLWWNMTFDGTRPSLEDDLRWKTTFAGRRPLMENNLSLAIQDAKQGCEDAAF